MRVSAPCNLEGTDHVSSFVFLMPALHSFVSSFFSLFIQQTFLVFSTYNELDKVLGTPWQMVPTLLGITVHWG